MIRFYGEVLGCPVHRIDEKIRLVQLRAGRGLIDLVPVDSELGRAGGAAPGRGGRNVDHFCLRVDPWDAEAIREHLQAHGVQAGAVAMRFGAEGQVLPCTWPTRKAIPSNSRARPGRRIEETADTGGRRRLAEWPHDLLPPQVRPPRPPDLRTGPRRAPGGGAPPHAHGAGRPRAQRARSARVPHHGAGEGARLLAVLVRHGLGHDAGDAEVLDRRAAGRARAPDRHPAHPVAGAGAGAQRATANARRLARLR